MMTDEHIEATRQELEPFLGPTRAGWWAEACKVEYDDPPDVLLWACRYREMAMEAGRLEMTVAYLKAKLERLEREEAGGG